tara:strand:- start:74 stop:304 length:231 start_codon:yes stop_codon:yes gene_type:complete
VPVTPEPEVDMLRCAFLTIAAVGTGATRFGRFSFGRFSSFLFDLVFFFFFFFFFFLRFLTIAKRSSSCAASGPALR